MAWAIMPNHVHVVLKPLAGQELPKIVQSWKSFTAKEINRLLNRQGTLWMDEYYDHLIRDEKDFANQINYARDKSREGRSAGLAVVWREATTG